jgi:hypothetical protein
MIHQQEIHLRTKGHRHLQDLTGEVANVVRASGVRSGLVHMFNVGSTGAIGTIEFEPGLEQDLPAVLDKLFPPSRDYGHEQAWHDGNGHSHTGSGPDSPNQRGTNDTWHVAADFSFGMRHQTARTNHCDNHHRGRLTFEAKRTSILR